MRGIADSWRNTLAFLIASAMVGGDRRAGRKRRKHDSATPASWTTPTCGSGLQEWRAQRGYGALVASEIGYALAGPVWGGSNVCTELPNSPHHYTMSQKFELPEGHFLFTSYVSAHF